MLSAQAKEVGQNIGDMVRWADYIAPMVYPSHWGPGEYDVRNPNAQPFPIVHRSLKDFQKKVAGTTAEVMPWLKVAATGGETLSSFGTNSSVTARPPSLSEA